MELKIITNTPGLAKINVDGVEIKARLYPAGKSKLSAGWEVFKRSFNYDYIIIVCDPSAVAIQGLLHLLIFFNDCKVISVDSVLPAPSNLKEKVKCSIKGLCFKGVDVFIEYFKDTSGYTKHYLINQKKFRYVPFKINRYEKVLELIKNNEVSDEGYIFSGGNTRRDYSTLIEAARKTKYPVKIVTMDNKIIDKHGTTLDETSLPGNVEVIRHDGSDTFLDYIAKAKLVVLPVKKHNISASGIGVYLASMGLGKCVIISSGPAVDGVLSDEAIIVPPEGVDELVNAIEKAYKDDSYRKGYEDRAQKYALDLAGEERLYRSIIKTVINEIN